MQADSDDGGWESAQSQAATDDDSSRWSDTGTRMSDTGARASDNSGVPAAGTLAAAVAARIRSAGGFATPFATPVKAARDLKEQHHLLQQTEPNSPSIKASWPHGPAIASPHRPAASGAGSGAAQRGSEGQRRSDDARGSDSLGGSWRPGRGYATSPSRSASSFATATSASGGGNEGGLRPKSARKALAAMSSPASASARSRETA